MSLPPLTLLKNRIQFDVALEDYWQATYGRDARHLIGYKWAPAATDYPAVCYVPVRSLIDHKGNESHLLSLVFGIYEPAITDGVFDGVARMSEIEERMLTALTPLQLNTDYHVSAEPVRIITDLGERHPFYETELQLVINRGRYGKN